MKHILSIDFDYFQNVDAETVVSCYPDGVDVSTALSLFTWATHYSGYGSDKLRAVSVDENKLKQMKNILAKCRNARKVMLTNSHAEIYRFIHSIAKEGTKLDVINVDMHHDMFNENNEVDCGNWVSHIAKEYDTNIIWIANPISRDVYGLGENCFDMIGTDLDIINPSQIDAIFICRSDNWTPPHLDHYFDELFTLAKTAFPQADSVTASRGVMKPRDMAQIEQFVRDTEEYMRQHVYKKTQKEKGDKER